ncbi:MAG: T9SS type A sorting domain-containing protein [Chitinophagales bacterium]|nr:T9SS type A sorting domain-containing protein [Chitinophagales bacterium]
MKSKHLLLCCIAAANGCFGQNNASATIATNNISARFFSNGMVSFDGNKANFSVPKDSNAHALYAGSLWVGGFDNTYGVLHISTMTYDDSLTNFRFGPIANSYSGTYSQRYNKVWKVKQSDIDYHLLHYNDVGYTAPTDILDWPGNGNTGNGEPLLLAPFADLNGNFLYEPNLGEYPLIKGDEALYIVYSDRANPNNVLYGNPLKVDVHLMVYAYEGFAAPHLRNSLFCHYNIVNRANDGYYNVLIGSWSDFSLGCFNDDHIGSDSALSTFYVYNGSFPDVDCQGVKGYQTTKATFGISFLNKDLHAFMWYMSSAGFPPHTQAYSPFQHYNFMNAIWGDGNHLTYGGSGYSGTTQHNYIFSGNPCAPSQWSEISNNIVAGDRRGLGSTGKFNLPKSGNLCFDLAYVFAEGNPQAACFADGVDSLKKRIQQVRSFYNFTAPACYSFSTGTAELHENDFHIYPNPAKNTLTVELKDNVVCTLQLFDVSGKEIMRAETRLQALTLNTANVNAGVYFLVIKSATGQFVRKVVIEK